NGSLRRPSTGRTGSVPFVLPAARRLAPIFVNPLYEPAPSRKTQKMPSEDLSDGICGKTGRAGGSEEDFAPA
ncbi:hypothetical protein, partial [Neisseria gonorrhoeae]